MRLTLPPSHPPRAARAHGLVLLLGAFAAPAAAAPAKATEAAAAHLAAIDALFQPARQAEQLLIAPRIGPVERAAPCAAAAALVEALRGAGPGLEGPLRAEAQASAAARAEACETLGAPLLKLLADRTMTEAKLREADALYLQLLTELQQLDDEDNRRRAAFAKKSGVEAAPWTRPPESKGQGLGELPPTGTGFEPLLVAQAARAHHKLMISYMIEAKAAMETLVQIPAAPGAPIAEALPKAVGKVARARSGCDEAGAWFEDSSLLDACAKVTNTYSRLLSGPLADLSLDCAEDRWRRRTQARVRVMVEEVQADLPSAEQISGAASGTFQEAWGLRALPLELPLIQEGSAP